MYLCAGTHASIEGFDPEALVFTKVWDLPKEVPISVAFSFDDSVYFLNNKTVGKERGNMREKIEGEKPS